MAQFLSIFLQIIVGIFVVYVLYVIALWTMASDKLVTTTKYNQNIKKKTRVLTGWIEATSFYSRIYNTVQSSHPQYVDITRSVNRKGGTQFSYSFWMFITKPEHLFDGKGVACPNNPGGCGQEYYLFVKGDSTRYTYQIDGKDTVKDLAVMCPAICLGDFQHKNLAVKFNTIGKLNETVKLEGVPSIDSTIRHNISSLTPRKWVLYTFVFMDNVPLNDFENGIVVKSYVNDVLYRMDRHRSSIRENHGEIGVLPDGPPGPGTGLKLSDLTYYNYALSDVDVIKVYEKGVSTNMHSEAKNEFGQTLELSSFNKLDIYNL